MNKAIIDIRLRQRCAIPLPPLRPIGRITCARKFSEYYLRLFGKLNDPFCCTMLWLLIIDRDAAATAAAKIANAFEWPGQPLKISLPFGGSAPPSNTWFLRPIRIFIQDGISLGSEILHSSP